MLYELLRHNKCIKEKPMNDMNMLYSKMQKSMQKQMDETCSYCGRPLIANPPYVDDSREKFEGMRLWEQENGIHYICLQRMQAEQRNKKQ